MISVLIECLDEEHALAQTLAALVPGAVEGLVSDVIVIDRGSRDGSVKVADSAGCTVVKPAEAGEALSQARGRWLLVLEPGARPLAGWIEALSGHVADGGERAARFPARAERAGLAALLRPGRFEVVAGRRAAASGQGYPGRRERGTGGWPPATAHRIGRGPDGPARLPAYAGAAPPRFRCSSSRGMISTKLQGRWR
jgi:hypothetical protein